MRLRRMNERYLPEARFPDLLQVADSLDASLDGVGDVIIAVPSNAFRALLQELAPRMTRDVRVAWATKGFEHHSGLLPNQVAREVLGHDYTMAVLSGPTFAKEVGRGLPTSMVVASADADFAMKIAADLASPEFRTYVSTDITGVEIGGAVKNVIALGAGLSDGLGFGANMRVALITRGLAEMTRLGIRLGARERTFMGLAGLGDLVLTCTDDQSRNRRCGLALARGLSAEAAMHEIGQVVEGYLAARVLREVAARLQLDLPVCEGICRILFDGADARTVVRDLMAQPPQAEFE
jgi:glycerol-3-phosphate dehydrogenase (NAD(P)+)